MFGAQPAGLEPVIWGPHATWVMKVVKEEWQGVVRGRGGYLGRRLLGGSGAWAKEWGMERGWLDDAGQREGRGEHREGSKRAEAEA